MYWKLKCPNFILHVLIRDGNQIWNANDKNVKIHYTTTTRKKGLEFEFCMASQKCCCSMKNDDRFRFFWHFILPIPKVATFRTFFKSQNVIANNRLCITCKIGHKKTILKWNVLQFRKDFTVWCKTTTNRKPKLWSKDPKKVQIRYYQTPVFLKGFFNWAI